MNSRIYAQLSLLLVILFLAGCAILPSSGNQTDPALKQSIPTDPNLVSGTLENGVRYFIKTNGKPENRAELRLAINAGSILETDDQQGLAHLLEHMAFNGTEHFPRQDLVNYLESIGMRFGPDLNAYTSFDETVYMLQVPTDNPEQFETAFQILEDWAHRMSLEGEEIDAERGVVVEEWRLGQGANRRMLDKELPILLKGSRYAERLPIGKVEVIESADYETVRSFYRDWYRPDLMAVIVVGDFEVETAKAMIESYFGRIAKPEKPTQRPLYDVPTHRETLYAIVTDPEATRSEVSVYYKHPGRIDRTLEDFRTSMVERLYDAMLNARFQEIAQQPDAPFLYAYSGSWSWTRTGRMYTVGSVVPDGGVTTGMEAMLKEAERVRLFGFTQSELERQQKEMLRNMERLYLERDKQESRRHASELIRHFLKEEAVPGIDAEYAFYQKYLPTVTLDEVNALPHMFMTDENRVVSVNAPEKAGLETPTQDELAAVLAKISTLDITPYEDAVSDAPLLSELPTAGTIVSRKQIDDLGVTEWTLSNGIRMVLKPTDFKNDEVLFSSYSPGGTSLISDEQLISGDYAAVIVNNSGLGEFDQIALEKKLAGQAVSVSPYISTLFEGISGSASPQDLETLFQLIHLYFGGIREDADAFQVLMNRMESGLKNRDANPEAAYSDTVAVTYSQYHPRRLPINMERFAQINLDDALSVYRDRFADAGDFTFIFVGSFELSDLEPLAEQYLASLPNTGRDENWRDEGVEFPDGKITKAVYRGLEPKSRTRIAFHGDFEWDRQARYDAYSMMSVLRIRLREVLREDMGGVYGVGAWISLDRYPDGEYLAQVTFGCDPERVDELTEAVINEIRALQAAPPDAANVEKVRETQRNERKLGLKQNSYWMNALNSYYRDNRDLSKFMQFDELVDGLNGEAIQAAAKRHFNFDNMVQITLYPEEMADSK